MPLPIYQADAFTSKAFSGNSAAVCILPKPADEKWMQQVAMEMNLAETAFLHKIEDGYNLRWFTPSVEVDLCGHATLASAHILWETGYLPSKETARFHTKSGILTAEKNDEWITLNFPAEPEIQHDAPDHLEKALGARLLYCGINRFDYLVEVGSEEIVNNLKPDFNLLSTIQSRGIIVTAKASSPGHDFVSRFFAPACGINEDPVTGSAHCCLGPYWKKKLNQEEFTAYQASPRGGIVKVKLAGNRVLLSGQAVTVMKGELLNY